MGSSDKATKVTFAIFANPIKTMDIQFTEEWYSPKSK